MGIVLGGIVMIFVAIYAVGKFAVIDSSPNVVTNTFLYQNDPYELDLSNWNLRISVFENVTKQFVTINNMYHLGLNFTAYNLYG